MEIKERKGVALRSILESMNRELDDDGSG